MKFAKYLLILWVLLLTIPACSSAEKAAVKRRNLMMPETTDLKRNSKYKPVKQKKTYKPKKQKKRKNKKNKW